MKHTMYKHSQGLLLRLGFKSNALASMPLYIASIQPADIEEKKKQTACKVQPEYRQNSVMEFPIRGLNRDSLV